MTVNNRAHRSHTPGKLNETGMRAALTVRPSAGGGIRTRSVTAEDVRVKCNVR